MDSSQPIKIKVIIGSTRQNRFSEKPANWIYDEVKKCAEVEVELLDLREYPLPFFNDPVSPSYRKGEHPEKIVRTWAKKIEEADGYLIVTPEYNHGYPAVLKNAIDHVYYEWNKKPVGFISYGGVGGARSVEQLRQVAVELQMVPIRNAIHIPGEVYMAALKESVPVNPEVFGPVKEKATGMIEQLLWWARALKTAREV